MDETTLQAKKAFETVLSAKGKPIPPWDGKYKTANTQTYWRWFVMGWKLRELSK